MLACVNYIFAVASLRVFTFAQKQHPKPPSITLSSSIKNFMVELLQFHCFDKVFKENTSMSVMFFWFNNFAILTIVETVNDGIVGDGRELTTWRFHFLDDIICILLGGTYQEFQIRFQQKQTHHWVVQDLEKKPCWFSKLQLLKGLYQQILVSIHTFLN